MKEMIFKEPEFGSFFVIKKQLSFKEEYLVVGSKGDTYTIRSDSYGCYHCSCKGYAYRGWCSHIKRFQRGKIKWFKSIMNKVDGAKRNKKECK